MKTTSITTNSKTNDLVVFYRVTQLAQILNVSKSTIWLWVKKGTFPKPYYLGDNTTAWSAEDVCCWIDSRVKDKCSES